MLCASLFSSNGADWGPEPMCGRSTPLDLHPRTIHSRDQIRRRHLLPRRTTNACGPAKAFRRDRRRILQHRLERRLSSAKEWCILPESPGDDLDMAGSHPAPACELVPDRLSDIGMEPGEHPAEGDPLRVERVGQPDE